ncbi:choice-of-anchor E domain-containing protein [Anabaena subtropica]|uniref:Choice-of-anchor E domain-containing protein n=1 Tax=Anabaena subtropica FACHB-260 TaxID=2692884 RepID=A0ABR8CMF3_9NOST|nr:choice-of-anchor E domain-containing protein [Anabaena subtropica]MBD2343529.1 choice-of-anchor E domain-containing protein [Anabaena subtropica FACHB-260]
MTTTLFKTLGAATTLAGIIATAGSASAATISFSGGTNFAPTDIVNQSIGVSKFDTSLGTLRSVTLQFTGDVTGEAGFENRASNAATIAVTLAGNLTLELDSILLSLNPENISSYQVSSFDQRLDFAGASGKTIAGLNATGSDTRTYTDSAILQSFIGTGDLNFLFSAIATSQVSGSGNITSYVDTLAKAGITVIYDFDPAQSVPEPTSVLGFGLFAGAAFLAQRKKSAIKISNS